MADFEDKMVLRTVYLPFELDQELKSLAFRDNRTKNDLIRELIKAGMETAMGGDSRFRVKATTRQPVPTAKIQPRVLGALPAAAKGKAAGTKATKSGHSEQAAKKQATA